MRRHPRTLALAGPIALVLVPGACGDDAGPAVDATPTTVAATSPTTAPPAGPTTSPATAAPAGGGGGGGAGSPGGGDGCAGTSPAVPAGAASAPVVDVDGDGRPDTAWASPRAEATRPMGIVTAAGGAAEFAVDTPSPQPVSLFVADADATPPVELFVSDGRTVWLFAFQDCAVSPVTNPEGEQYLFDLGFRGNGTGVGCVDVGGARQLVGLNVTDDDGTTVTWSRTVIERDGLTASNGPTDEGTFTRPEDGDAIDLLHEVTCGDRTLDADGLTQPRA